MTLDKDCDRHNIVTDTKKKKKKVANIRDSNPWLGGSQPCALIL